jgi:hypothetical protein
MIAFGQLVAFEILRLRLRMTSLQIMCYKHYTAWSFLPTLPNREMLYGRIWLAMLIR